MTAWRCAAEVLWRRSGDRVILLAPGQDECILLEGTGAVIWQLLLEPTDEDDLVATLARWFDVPADTIRDQASTFLAELHELELVRRTGTSMLTPA